MQKSIFYSSLNYCLLPGMWSLTQNEVKGTDATFQMYQNTCTTKPRPFVNHCRKRMTSAAEVDPQHIKELCDGPEVGQFQVRSQSSEIPVKKQLLQLVFWCWRCPATL